MDKLNELTIETLEVEDERPFLLLSFFLRIGHWRNLFEKAKCKWIISKALNLWTEENKEHKFELAGYIITGTKLGLVLKIRNLELPKALHVFFQILNKLVAESLEDREGDLPDFLNSQADTNTNVQFHNLFETKMPMSPFLAKLITGRKIKLPYYDFRLLRLEERIRNYNFCSAVDYSGAIGPVKVELLSPEELNELEKITDC